MKTPLALPAGFLSSVLCVVHLPWPGKRRCVGLRGVLIVGGGIAEILRMGGIAKVADVKKGRTSLPFYALPKLAANYLAEASPDAIAEADADAFLVFLVCFLAGLAEASPDAIADAAEAAGAEAAAAGAEAEAIAEAAKAEVANIEAIMTAINFFILFPRLVKKMVIRFESMPNNDVEQRRLTGLRKKIINFSVFCSLARICRVLVKFVCQLPNACA